MRRELWTLVLDVRQNECDGGGANGGVSHQSRDWNEELQGCRELSRESLQERLHRERSIFKVRTQMY